MESAFIINAQTGKQMSPPVQFLRIPAVGELIWAPPNTYSVVRVVHSWTNGPNPVAAVHLAPAQNHPTNVAMAGQPSPF